MVWRRRWTVIIPFAVVSLGTLFVSLTIPDQYRSETVILVVPQKVPEDYVRSTVTAKIEDRLRSIEQQIRSRTRLEPIVLDFNLYEAERRRLPMEDIIERMQRDLTVNIVRGDAFRVAYSSDDPRKAMQVTERLATEFTKESLQDREVLATATTNFLQSQLDDARRRLTEQEAKVADFQRRHAGQLPSEREGNLQMLHNLEMQVQAVLDSANRDRDRRLFLERTLAEIEPQALGSRKPAAQANPGAPGSPAVDGAAVDATARGTTADQLDAAREALKSLELRLKPEHPDVIYMKRVIRDLEAKAAAEASAPSSPGSATAPPKPRTADEAATLRRIQDIRVEIASVDVHIASSQSEEKRLRDQIALFQGRVAATPALEAELTALTRDYNTIRTGYEALLAKQEESKMSAALERRQIGEIFKVLDPARLPEGPASPNRLLINLFGALAGLALGLGLVAVQEYRDQSLHSEDDVNSVLNLPVLAAIPVIETSRDRRRKRRKMLIGLASATAVVVIMLGVAAAAWSRGLIRLPLLFR